MKVDTEKPVANPTAVLREGVDGWAVLINMDTGASVALNPTGIAVWRLIDGKRTIKEIVQAFKAQFPSSPTRSVSDTVKDDVENLVATLTEEGLVGYRKSLEAKERERLTT